MFTPVICSLFQKNSNPFIEVYLKMLKMSNTVFLKVVTIAADTNMAAGIVTRDTIGVWNKGGMLVMKGKSGIIYHGLKKAMGMVNDHQKTKRNTEQSKGDIKSHKENNKTNADTDNTNNKNRNFDKQSKDKNQTPAKKSRDKIQTPEKPTKNKGWFF